MGSEIPIPDESAPVGNFSKLRIHMTFTDFSVDLFTHKGILIEYKILK